MGLFGWVDGVLGLRPARVGLLCQPAAFRAASLCSPRVVAGDRGLVVAFSLVVRSTQTAARCWGRAGRVRAGLDLNRVWDARGTLHGQRTGPVMLVGVV